ncbi:hypothetical protein HMPREF9399_0243 [Campylobacter coli JV20]|nr:hypothetical protein HMPREF9399_0243 [Campylobacter coli JV20]
MSFISYFNFTTQILTTKFFSFFSLIPISLLLFFYQRYKFHHNYLQEFLFHLLFFFKSTCT